MQELPCLGMSFLPNLRNTTWSELLNPSCPSQNPVSFASLFLHAWKLFFGVNELQICRRETPGALFEAAVSVQVTLRVISNPRVHFGKVLLFFSNNKDTTILSNLTTESPPFVLLRVIPFFAQQCSNYIGISTPNIHSNFNPYAPQTIISIISEYKDEFGSCGSSYRREKYS